MIAVIIVRSFVKQKKKKKNYIKHNYELAKYDMKATFRYIALNSFK